MQSSEAAKAGATALKEGSIEGMAARLALGEQLGNQSTIGTVLEALASVAGRYQTDEVLTAVRHIPAREAQFRPMPAWVREEVAEAYRQKGIEKLYSHQAAA